MTLRIRRGSEVDRLSYTPLEGELIYTTDSKKVYVGDSSTVGGNIITNSLAGGTLGSNLNTSTYSITNGGNLVINGSSGVITALSINIDNITLSPEESTNSVIRNTTSNSDLDFKVKVGTTDTTALLLDGSTGRAYIPYIVSSRIRSNTNTSADDPYVGNIIRIDGPDQGNTYVRVSADRGIPTLSLRYVNNSAPVDSISTSEQLGAIQFEKQDSGDSQQTIKTGQVRNRIYSRMNDINIRQCDETGAFRDTHLIRLTIDGLVGIGRTTPTEKLHVRGNIRAEGSIILSGPAIVGSYTNTTRSSGIPSPVVGMIIYNTTVNKFQGYQNGGWINLDTGTAAS